MIARALHLKTEDALPFVLLFAGAEEFVRLADRFTCGFAPINPNSNPMEETMSNTPWRLRAAQNEVQRTAHSQDLVEVPRIAMTERIHDNLPGELPTSAYQVKNDQSFE